MFSKLRFYIPKCGYSQLNYGGGGGRWAQSGCRCISPISSLCMTLLFLALSHCDVRLPSLTAFHSPRPSFPVPSPPPSISHCMYRTKLAISKLLSFSCCSRASDDGHSREQLEQYVVLIAAVAPPPPPPGKCLHL